jgi:hypothetical protein
MSLTRVAAVVNMDLVSQVEAVQVVLALQQQALMGSAVEVEVAVMVTQALAEVAQVSL